MASSQLSYSVLFYHARFERGIPLIVVTRIIPLGVCHCMVNDRAFDLTVVSVGGSVAMHQLVNAHLTKLVRLNQDDLCYGCRFLAVFVGLNMLA